MVPHTSIDTEAHWTKSGWHGWVYGWKLHLVTTVAAVWIPLAAELTPANAADNEIAPRLLPELPPGTALPAGRQQLPRSRPPRPVLRADDRELIASRRGRYPHTDGGVEVRRVFHALRSRAIENFNGQFKGIFDCQGQVPTRGLVATRRFTLGAVLVYQLTLLYRHEQRPGPPGRPEGLPQGRLIYDQASVSSPRGAQHERQCTSPEPTRAIARGRAERPAPILLG